MRRVCAWCQAELEPGSAGEGGPISHGICKGCREYFFSSMQPISLQKFLNTLKVPVLVVNSDVRVVGASQEALDFLGKSLAEIDGQRSGDIIECAYAKLPEGCGQSIHCRSCAIRLTVTETYTTGKSLENIPAYADREFNDVKRKVKFLLSTEKVGEMVLLRINEINSV